MARKRTQKPGDQPELGGAGLDKTATVGQNRTARFVDMHHSPAVVIRDLADVETAEVQGALVKLDVRLEVSARADVAAAKATLLKRGARAVAMGATFVSNVSMRQDVAAEPAVAKDAASSISDWFKRGAPKDPKAAEEWDEAEQVCLSLAAEAGL